MESRNSIDTDNYASPPSDDSSLPAAGNASAAAFYQNWAALQPDDAEEPPELCAVAVYMGIARVWKWGDVNCGKSYIFMCRLLREHLALVLLILRAALSYASSAAPVAEL